MKGKTIVTIAALATVLTITAAAMAGVVRGTSGNDTLPGTEQADLIRGFAGDDSLTGLGANDVLRAGRGNDIVSGGEGERRRLRRSGHGHAQRGWWQRPDGRR